MEKETLSPEDSLSLISDVIQNAQSRFEENGWMFMLWGLLLALASGAQFVLLLLEQYEISYYPYFLTILGWVVMFFYYGKNGRRRSSSSNIINTVINGIWVYLGINAALLGFLFASTLQGNLVPVLFILIGSGILCTGLALKNKWVIGAGIFSCVAGYASFVIDYFYQPLLVSIVYFVVLFIPGFILNRMHKKKYAA